MFLSNGMKVSQFIQLQLNVMGRHSEPQEKDGAPKVTRWGAVASPQSVISPSAYMQTMV